MSDSKPENIVNALLAAQAAIHEAPAGWPLSAALAEFKYIIGSWAQHPKGRCWALVDELDAFVKSMEKRNNG